MANQQPNSIQPLDLEGLVKQLEDSYFAFPRIHHIDRSFLPSREEVGGLIESLFAILYPGFFGRQDLSREGIREHLRDSLSELHHRLYRQIFQCFALAQGSHEHPIECQARHSTAFFMGLLPGLREVLASDTMAAYQGDPAAADTNEVIFSYPATLAIGIYRIAHELWSLSVPLIPRIMSEYAHSKTGIDIHPGAEIGRFFFIDHGTGVVIGETTIIGDHCKLYQGVTLGALSFPHDEAGQIIRHHKRHPTLEDHVVVYSNASILGNVTIGRRSTIGGGVFLTRSVPPGCTVSAVPVELRYRDRTDPEGRDRSHDFQI